jgi:hypothetical protein
MPSLSAQKTQISITSKNAAGRNESANLIGSNSIRLKMPLLLAINLAKYVRRQQLVLLTLFPRLRNQFVSNPPLVPETAVAKL